MSRWKREAFTVALATFGAAIARLLTQALYNWAMSELFIVAYSYEQIIAFAGMAFAGALLGVLLLHGIMLVARKAGWDRNWLPILIATCIFCLIPLLLSHSIRTALFHLPMAIVAGWLWRRHGQRDAHAGARPRSAVWRERTCWVAMTLLTGMAVVPPALASWQEEQAVLHPASLPPSLLGPRILGGVVHDGELWLFNFRGALASYRLSDWHPTERGGQAIDIKADGATLWVLIGVPLDSDDDQMPGRFAVTPYRAGGWEKSDEVAYAAGGRPLAMVIREGRPIVIGRRALYLLAPDLRSWVVRKLDHPIEAWGEVSSAFGDADMLYLGFNSGEWGGGIVRVDTASGAVKAVEDQGDADICGSPLDSGCDPINGIIPDREKPGCVLAAIGLSHMLSHGRIVRICHDKVDLVFERPILPIGERIRRLFSEHARRFPPETEPVFGLVPARDGYWAVTPRGLYRKSATGVARRGFPDLIERNGISVSTGIPGVIILSTDANAGKSLSGLTPMMIARP